MKEDSLAPELSLGRIEISMRDFLSLRPGDVLAFDLASQTEGVLKFCGNDWARVGVEFDGESVHLRVLKVEFHE